MSSRSPLEDVNTLDITLNGLSVGTMVRTPGDYNAFSFAAGYRALATPPILSLSFRAANGGLRNDPKPQQGVLPPFFSNLLPEDKLREAMEKHHAGTVRRGNDFDLLAALGADLPGAVRAMPKDGQSAPLVPAALKSKARFSLAGVQMKLSVMKNTGKEGGITLPVGNADGDFIAKFPSLNQIGLSENEFAMLALAKAVRMDVPENELVDKEAFDGIPKEFNTLATGRVLLLRRFDRTPAGRVHTEDFAQVFGLPPSRKYDGAGYHNIAEVLNIAVSQDASIDFVRRLAFSALTGNGDMHLKNWSLIYPDDGTKPAFAPVYDMLSTVAYLPDDNMALSLGGTKSFRSLTRDRWRNLAHRARLPVGAVENAVTETVATVMERWRTLPERDVVPVPVLDAIDQHIALMAPILDPGISL